MSTREREIARKRRAMRYASGLPAYGEGFAQVLEGPNGERKVTPWYSFRVLVTSVYLPRGWRVVYTLRAVMKGKH